MIRQIYILKKRKSYIRFLRVTMCSKNVVKFCQTNAFIQSDLQVRTNQPSLVRLPHPYSGSVGIQTIGLLARDPNC